MSKTDFTLKTICFILIFEMMLEHGNAAWLCAALVTLAGLFDRILDEIGNGWLIRQKIKINQRKNREDESANREG